MMQKILITGCAGFIGSQFAKKLIKNYKVTGIDNFDPYYSISLKKKRIKDLNKNINFFFKNIDITDIKKLNNFIQKQTFKYVFHFAAQAGVRYSVINPNKYTSTNIVGTINLLDCLKDKKPTKIFLASSSSVYGENNKFPLKESEKLSPINHYAYTKLINEETGKYYSKNFKMSVYMLRFFTVYGKWGRPDMFLFKLFKSVFEKDFFKLNNSGHHERDFTYIDDACEILFRLMKKKIKKKYDLYNICSSNPTNIKKIIYYLEDKVGLNLKIKNISRNKLDVLKTHGSNKKVTNLIGFKKFTKYQDVIENIFKWYKSNKIYKF
jgi:UDP-glucuronate 4-epimerase